MVHKPYLAKIAQVIMQINIPAQFSPGWNYENYLLTANNDSAHLRLHCINSTAPFLPRSHNFQNSQDIVQTQYLARPKHHIFARKQEAFIGNLSFTQSKAWCSSDDYFSTTTPHLGNCGWPLLALWAFHAVKGTAILLHGSLLEIDNKNILFLGDSGAGKSTLSRLAINNGASCFTDEYPFFAFIDNTPQIFGTPGSAIYN